MGLIIYTPGKMREIDRIREEFRTRYELALESPGNFQEFLSNTKSKIMKYPHFFPDEISLINEQERILTGHA